jgi:hypothetical protein
MTMNFLNSDWFRRFIASSNRTTCPPHNFECEVNKSHVAVGLYNIYLLTVCEAYIIVYEDQNLIYAVISNSIFLIYRLMLYLVI